MSAVDFEYYSESYYGTEADEGTFPALNARAEDIIGSLTKWQVNDDTLGTFPGITQMLYKKAVCAQIDFLAVNGLSSVVASDGKGFTVGKVTVHEYASSYSSKAGRMVCPLSLQLLEQSGLMGAQIPTAPDIPAWGWWNC